MRARLVLVALTVAAAGCASPLTGERLSPSFAETFAGLYETQQTRHGRIDVVAADLKARAACRRTGAEATGPGEDWTCVVQYVDRQASAAEVFEVQVKPDGCWKAEGIPTRQPPVIEDAVTGERTVNPLLEFDGCFDTSWG